MTELPPIAENYAVLPSLLRRYDRFARQMRFDGNGRADFLSWQSSARKQLALLLGLDKMQRCPLRPRKTEECILQDGIRREHWLIETEPGVVMPFYLLIPPDAGADTKPFLCPPGHGGAGKYSVAGLREYTAVSEKIDFYNYDYGMQLARCGYVALCPDCRGFGERREELSDTRELPGALTGDCVRLARMGEPLGIPVLGMLVWDLMRAADFLAQHREWAYTEVSSLGFSGGAMQTLFLSALDERISLAVVSGYFYGYRDSLLRQSWNCSCNYVPHLWEYFDMGDIASLIAPRPLLIQTCRDDRQNGPRGVENVLEQMMILREAYRLLDAEHHLIHEIYDGSHRWHGEHLRENLFALTNDI